MIGDEFKISNVRWSEQVLGRQVLGQKPWYMRMRYYVYAIVIFASFQAGQYYNATRQLDTIGLPPDYSDARELGMVAPVEYRLEVGML